MADYHRTRRGVTIGIVTATFVATAAVAWAAAAPAEVVSSGGEITVERGGSTIFSVEVGATPDLLRCSATPTTPATATFRQSYFLDAAGTLTAADSPTARVEFYAKPIPGSTLCTATWDGDPKPMTIQLSIETVPETPTGTYSLLLRSSTATPSGTGETLRDSSPTSISILVVETSDVEPPTFDCAGPAGTLAASGWYRSDVSFSCTAFDGGSGLANPDDASFALTSVEEGSQVFTPARLIADTAGNVATAGPFGPFMIDQTAPTVSIASPPAVEEAYAVGTTVPASFSCNDSLSGVASCDGTVASGALLDTSSVGTKSVAVTATDAAGNATTVVRSYRVVYDFTGFFAPARDGATVQAGSSVPIKWSLGGVSETSTFVQATSAALDCDAVPEDGDASTIEPMQTPGSSSLVYDPVADQFVLVWKTQSEWRGCRRLAVSLNDGTVHYVKLRMSSTKLK